MHRFAADVPFLLFTAVFCYLGRKVRIQEGVVKERLFTVDEANALIPRLEIVIGKLQRNGLALRAALEKLARETDRAPADVTTDDLLRSRPQLNTVVEECDTLLGEVESYGGQLKGLDLGLVDFPTVIEGDVVLLCWQYGEKEVSYYHSCEAGFAGRKPLDPQAPQRTYLQ